MPATPTHTWTPADGLLISLLAEQESTAVEQFARWHDRSDGSAESGLAARYQSLLPATAPGPDQQYAFEVDLDACSGCQACVAACHQLNGLDEGEMWRSVGLLLGGSAEAPVAQHVTAACHHCLEPACLDGCPVLAYDKDPLTGIVRHLDDQCIGCQYCILQCPYDVPKYNARLGIVRKCDMCRQRLDVGQAPACVQSCPNSAIRIRLVERETIREDCEANQFVPGAAPPGLTLPTTVYRTSRALPRNLLSVNYFAAAPQHPHWPLVWMLVLTQMSAGALAMQQGLAHLGPAPLTEALGDPFWSRVSALALGLTGLLAAVLHLGRPQYAYRAILNLRRSWLSREIVAFGVYAALATALAVSGWLTGVGWIDASKVDQALALAAVFAGLAAVFCSAMIYISTRRPGWGAANTVLKFYGTATVLGLATTLLVHRTAAFLADASPAASGAAVAWLSRGLMVAVLLKLTIDVAPLAWLSSGRMSPQKRTALLMSGDLAVPTLYRIFLGAIGGVALPAILIAVSGGDGTGPGQGNAALFGLLLATVIWLTLHGGELLERYLFFAAVPSPYASGAHET